MEISPSSMRSGQQLAPRSVRIGAIGGVIHIGLMVAIEVLIMGFDPVLKPENISRVIVWLTLGLILTWLVRVPRQEAVSRKTLGGWLLVLLGGTIAGGLLSVVSQSAPPANTISMTVSSYLLMLALSFYIYGGMAIVGAVPALLWAEYRMLVPTVITAIGFLGAVLSAWEQAQAPPALLPIITGYFLYLGLWFIVPVLATIGGSVEFQVRKAMGTSIS